LAASGERLELEGFGLGRQRVESIQV
jgi:hypothetical protein